MTTIYTLIKATIHGIAATNSFGRDGIVRLENPTAEQWVEALAAIDVRHSSYDREELVSVIAVATNEDKGTVGKAATLKRCAICDQLQAPRRPHTCDRHHNPRVGDVYHKVNSVRYWVGDGEPDHSLRPDEHPHLYREERTIDLVEVTGINYIAPWTCFEGTEYPGEFQIVTREVTHERHVEANDGPAPFRTVVKTEELEYDLGDWRYQHGTARKAAAYAKSTLHWYGWTLVKEGRGSSLAEALTLSKDTTEDFGLAGQEGRAAS